MKLNPIRTFRYFWKMMQGQRWIIFAMLILLALGSTASSFVPVLFKKIADAIEVFAGGDRSLIQGDLVRYALFLGLAVFLHMGVFNRINAWLLGVIITETSRKMLNDIFGSLQRHSHRFFVNSFIGSLVAKASKFVNSFHRMFDIVLWSMGSTLMRFIIVIIITSFYSQLVAGIFVVWFLFYVWFSWYLSLKKIPYDNKRSRYQSKVTGIFADTLTNAITIKIFGAFKPEMKNIEKVTMKQRGIQRDAWYLGVKLYTILLIALCIFFFGIVYISIMLWVKGLITFGTVVMIHTYSYLLMQKIRNIAADIRNMYEALANCEEIMEIMYLEKEVQDPQKPKKCQIKDGEVVFNTISFAYGDGKDVMKKFDLTLEPGKKYGLVGPSGAGKSTITKLMLRFADVQKGGIIIDGQDVRDLKQDDLRKHISYVPQDPILFHRSLRENIGYGDPKVTEKDIIAAAKKAHAHEFIKSLPQGYDTLVGERGVKLSGGERQRVAIARAMLKKAPILILDEATSSLDSVSENYIQEALDTLMKGKTTLVIAHRLSTIQKMDEIIVMDKGKITERGTHKGLIRKKGKYAELWSHQSHGFLPV